jgi:hypothetical protein
MQAIETRGGTKDSRAKRTDVTPDNATKVARRIVVMKRIALFSLLLAAVAATSAHAAHVAPLQNRVYECWYTHPTMGETNPSASTFKFIYMNTSESKRGIEDFTATWGQDNRKFTFAKPVDGYHPYFQIPMTTWEFTINPSGPQCRKTEVVFGGYRIDFKDCSDGHSRVCTTPLY